MRFGTSDPDVATIMRRVSQKKIDLQPEFQRGEVWSTGKKQRLIDTILRRWHVPPIHLVARGDGKYDVLDGQQRLSAIRDFMDGEFQVDGTVAPLEAIIESLDGKRYQQLPEGVRDEFDAFPIRVFELYDYKPDEPHELFFRLNQPTALTEAEKRNAFIGGPRNQVRDLVSWSRDLGMMTERIGFSDARMAYDDLVARFLLTLEQRTLTEKVTAQRITNRYRLLDDFSEETIIRARAALAFVLGMKDLDSGQFRPNKATFHSWLCIAAEADRGGYLQDTAAVLESTISWIETNRGRRAVESRADVGLPLAVFNDRATARVGDAASVILRDFTAWMMLESLHPGRVGGPITHLLRGINGSELDDERSLLRLAQDLEWGREDWI